MAGAFGTARLPVIADGRVFGNNAWSGMRSVRHSFFCGRSQIDQIHLMQVFVTVGEEGGFAAAARRLDISPAAVTRAIVALEDELGVPLLLRTTRNVRLTDAGRQYFDDTRAILASIEEANEAVSGANAEPRGLLSLTAPVMFGRALVMPCIVEYMRRHPQVEVSAHFVDRVVNMVEEGLDVAVRIGHLPDSTLRAARVGQIRRVLCASPAYLEAHGTPAHPADLLDHTIVSSSGVSTKGEWRFALGDENLSVRIKPRLAVTSNEAARDAAVGGLGVSRLLSYQVAEHVERGELRLVLEDFEEEPWPVHIVHREGRHGSAKVRAFIDLAVERLRAHPHLQG
jgi:DNA-binding transcriptional LysR family regulator